MRMLKGNSKKYFCWFLFKVFGSRWSSDFINPVFHFQPHQCHQTEHLVNAFIVDFITFHLFIYQTCKIEHLTTTLAKRGVSLLCTLNKRMWMCWSPQLAWCCEAPCSQCCRSVPQCHSGGGLHHDGDGSRLGGISGGGEGGSALRGAEPGLPPAAGGVRERRAGRSERTLISPLGWDY